jgi:hypothetical protein
MIIGVPRPLPTQGIPRTLRAPREVQICGHRVAARRRYFVLDCVAKLACYTLDLRPDDVENVGLRQPAL